MIHCLSVLTKKGFPNLKHPQINISLYEVNIRNHQAYKEENKHQEILELSKFKYKCSIHRKCLKGGNMSMQQEGLKPWPGGSIA